MAFTSVQIQLVLGHKATLRDKRTPQGFTHDWEVFIRGPEKTNIQSFVEKVVFYLHKDFHKPKRVVKEPTADGAYVVKESGYGCFSLPIEVYFKNKDEPRKVRFEYDLFLQSEGPPISHVRYEKMTFKNPSEDFRMKLIKGGGVGVTNGDAGTVLTTADKNDDHAVNSSSASYSFGAKKPPGSGDSSKKHKIKEPKSESAHFNDLFGTPSKLEKTEKSSDSKKSSSKESSAKKESLSSKDARISSGSNSATKQDIKREKPDKIEKESKKEQERPSLKSSKDKDLEKKLRKEEKSREEKKPLKEKSKKAEKEKKDKLKERDKDSKDKKDAKDSKDGKDTKDSRLSLSSTKPQTKPIEIKTKEIKEDPEVMRKMFGDDIDPPKSRSSKDEVDSKKMREDKDKGSKLKSESSKTKLDKMNDLFKEVSKPDKEKRVEKSKDKKESSKNKLTERPPSVSSVSSTNTAISTAPAKLEKQMKAEKKEKSSSDKRSEKRKSTATPVPDEAPKKPPAKVSNEKKLKETSDKKSNDRPREKPETKPEIVKKKPEVEIKKEPVQPVPSTPTQPEVQAKGSAGSGRKADVRPVKEERRRTSSTSSTSSSSSSSSSSSRSSSSSSSSSTSSSSSSSSSSSASSEARKRVTPSINASSSATVRTDTFRPIEVESSIKKEKVLDHDDDTTVRTNGLSVNSHQRLNASLDEKKEVKKEKRTPTPLMKRKQSSSPDPDIVQPSATPSNQSTGDNLAGSDSKKAKVELPDLALFTPEYLSQLVELQQKIGSLNDKDIQRIVDVVKSTGAYQVSSTSFDFDLCDLDSVTIRRIQQCLT